MAGYRTPLKNRAKVVRSLVWRGKLARYSPTIPQIDTRVTGSRWRKSTKLGNRLHGLASVTRYTLCVCELQSVLYAVGKQGEQRLADRGSLLVLGISQGQLSSMSREGAKSAQRYFFGLRADRGKLSSGC